MDDPDTYLRESDFDELFGLGISRNRLLFSLYPNIKIDRKLNVKRFSTRRP